MQSEFSTFLGRCLETIARPAPEWLSPKFQPFQPFQPASFTIQAYNMKINQVRVPWLYIATGSQHLPVRLPDRALPAWINPLSSQIPRCQMQIWDTWIGGSYMNSKCIKFETIIITHKQQTEIMIETKTPNLEVSP